MWHLTAHQFARLWAEASAYPTPYPLRHRATGTTIEDHDAHRRELDEWVQSAHDHRLTAALAVLADPELSIEATVTTDSGRRDLRLLGARRGATAVLAEQVHGDVDEINRDIRVFTGAADELAGSVMQAIPDNRPGTQRSIAVHENDIDAAPDVAVFQTVQPTDVTRARTLLRAPRSGAGHIAVLHGADEVAAPRWVDVAGDGRYLIHGSGQLQIRPASLTGIYRELSRCLAIRR